MYTDLTYVNLSLDPHYPRVVLVQRNLAKDTGQRVAAWKMIRNCTYLWWHPFRFDWLLTVEMADGYGNRIDRMAAIPGDRLALIRESTGRGRLVREAVVPGAASITVANRTLREVLSVHIYRGKRLLAVRPLLGSGEKAAFSFDQTVLIGTSLRLREGEPVDLTRLIGSPVEINLHGIRRGRIVMTGGGHGPSALPLCFSLEKAEWW